MEIGSLRDLYSRDCGGTLVVPGMDHEHSLAAQMVKAPAEVLTIDHSFKVFLLTS